MAFQPFTVLCLRTEMGTISTSFIVPQCGNDIAGFLATLRRNMRTVSEAVEGEWNRDVIIATTMNGKTIEHSVNALVTSGSFPPAPQARAPRPLGPNPLWGGVSLFPFV